MVLDKLVNLFGLFVEKGYVLLVCVFVYERLIYDIGKFLWGLCVFMG